MKPWRASVACVVAAALTFPAVTASGQATSGQTPAARPAQAPKPAGSSRPGEDKSQPVTVDADRMERFGKESLVVFIGNVIARQNGSVQHADRMEVYLDDKGDRILRTVSTGNVRIITKDCKTGTARRAEYFDLEQRMVLIGNARVWQEDNVVSGETITIYTSQDRSIVEAGKQERVKAVFYQKDQDQKDKEAREGPRVARGTATACAN